MTDGSHSTIILADEVRAARDAGEAVVALESTLVAQGLPWPENLQTARDAEDAVRRAGAVPATVAVVAGRLRIGLDPATLEQIARSGRFTKAGRRDLAAAVAAGADAATTVSATLWAARRTGIGAMATGGLGGVHRDSARTHDISADLDELARADGVLLVCSGVKSILDLPASLERLETLGVAIVGYRTDHLPGFTASSSGLPLESRVDDPATAAALVQAHRALGLPGAVVLTQQVPADAAIPAAEMDAAIATAEADARAEGISGKAITPFLLDRVRRATSGRSLAANRALIVANASLAGAVAAAITAFSPPQGPVR